MAIKSEARIQLPFGNEKYLLATGNRNMDFAVPDHGDGAPPQWYIADASAGIPGDRIAAHHGAAADINRFTDLQLAQNDFRLIGAFRSATREDNNCQ